LIATHRPGEAQRLLQQMRALRYKAPWEVVVVLDRLPQKARQEIYELIPQLPMPVQIVEVEATPPEWSPKKYALAQGLEKAQYPWVVVLDADVEVGEDYLERLLGEVEEGVDAVVGLGWLRAESKGVELFAAWEAALIQVESVGRAAWGYPYMTTGRGWAVKKSWLKQGLYLWREVVSGDDDLTLQLIPPSNVRASGAATISGAPQSWGAYFRRKRRHLQTARYYKKGVWLSLAVLGVAYLGLWGIAWGSWTFLGGAALSVDSAGNSHPAKRRSPNPMGPPLGPYPSCPAGVIPPLGTPTSTALVKSPPTAKALPKRLFGFLCLSGS
jgi:glycosyltransferase involved in cell wall biosynthesis